MNKWMLFFALIGIFACTSDTIVLVEPDCNDDYTYENGIRDIITVSCASSGCHEPNGDAPGIYTTFESMSSWFGPEGIEKTIRDGSMPPQGSQQLTEEETSALLCWIEAGYPEI
jgi:hypothetical protein